MTRLAAACGPLVGEPAPDFELRDQHGQAVRLSDFRGNHAVLLAFFPYAFTPTCTGELRMLGYVGDPATGDVVTLGVSCDAGPSLKAFAAAERVAYPLLSDFWPHGEVARSYGVFFDERGFALRGTFLIDTAGIVRWKVVNPTSEARSTEDYRSALAAL